MLAVLYFLIFIILVIVSGPLIAYPLYVSLLTITDIEFHKLIGHATLLCGLLLGFIYLRINNIPFSKGFGYALPRKLFVKQMLTGIGFGILIIICLVLTLFLTGVYEVENDLNLSINQLIKIILTVFVAGSVVGLIEETIFRGFLFSGLHKKTNALTTIMLTSLVYAAVHFIKYREIENGIVVNWYTGLEMIPDALFRFRDPAIIDSFLTLFALGVLLSLIRLRNGNIAMAAGVHAGIVIMIKLSGEFSDYAANNAYPFLVNKYDHLLGYLAFVWLVLLGAVYYWKSKQARSE
jgi:membrane protease YdiL (CAAX protease family)